MTEGIKWRKLSNGELRAHVAVCGCGKVHNCPGGIVMWLCQACRDRGVKAGAGAGYFPVVELYVEEWDGVAW